MLDLNQKGSNYDRIKLKLCQTDSNYARITSLHQYIN